ncbi:hypothetical protein ACFX13_030784 [Malus domestica]
MDSLEPGKLILEKDRNAAIMSKIDQTMKKHTDNLLHVLESVSARLTQLKSRTRNLENSVNDLKISVGNNHGNTDGMMRQLEDLEKHHLPDHGGQDPALQSHQDGDVPPPLPESSSSEPLDENLFSDLTVQFQTLPNPEGPLTQTHDDLVQNQTPASKPTPPATTSRQNSSTSISTSPVVPTSTPSTDSVNSSSPPICERTKQVLADDVVTDPEKMADWCLAWMDLGFLFCFVINPDGMFNNSGWLIV